MIRCRRGPAGEALVPLLEETPETSLVLCLVRTQREGSSPQARQKALTRNRIGQHPDLGPPASGTVIGTFLGFEPPAYSILLRLPELREMDQKEF